MISSDATLVGQEDKVQRLKVEKARKGRISLSVDGTEQGGPRLVDQMRESTRVGVKARHRRAKRGDDIEL
jgi:hypothetical protein